MRPSRVPSWKRHTHISSRIVCRNRALSLSLQLRFHRGGTPHENKIARIVRDVVSATGHCATRRFKHLFLDNTRSYFLRSLFGSSTSRRRNISLSLQSATAFAGALRRRASAISSSPRTSAQSKGRNKRGTGGEEVEGGSIPRLVQFHFSRDRFR